ncbi:hypothetical protein M899_0064 [Bacteriovorax sp. BSW11_IV]|uniref:roadblock/LC7 domain-containing protein n=1 Tax=Bacteriovorax sp. BSW11_IV TaxID=1353529 RepID=UPI000389F0BF|nr:roadblock/LC7 domain-containing protein [Bacteriovorax sp. BSW11_IV]EQC42914.1 hypothetical protein M899_0064 [Bacteriovorax sp. BSW11_IV]
MNQEKFINSVNDFFENVANFSVVDNFAVIFARRDGVLLYSKSYFQNEIEKEAIGALTSGLWQAAKALIDMIPNTKDEDDFRLSFDTSSGGLYLLPVEHAGAEYQLGLVFKDMTNPAQLKNKIRTTRDQLEYFLQEVFVDNNETPVLKSESDFLFNDITDDEVDSLFAFGN